MADKKSSLIWRYFNVKTMDNSKAVCNACKIVMSRGKPGKPKDFSTTTMISHLRSKHPDLFNEMTALKSASSNITACASTSTSSSDSSSLTHKQQPGIKEVLDKAKLWDINSDNAKRIHLAIAKMIATDMEPYQVVEKPGFIGLLKVLEKRYTVPSRKYFTERVIPDIYDNISSKLREMLSDAKSIAFSTVTWTADNTTESYFGLTAHWLNESFDRSSYVLHCTKFNGQHTAANLLYLRYLLSHYLY